MTLASEPVRVERPASGGAVGHLADGRIVFLRHTAPGELVTVDVTDETSKICRGDAVEILEASPDRVTPPCRFAHVGGCGGCDFQHLTPTAQRSWKATVVSDQLRRIAGIDWHGDVEAVGATGEGTRTRLRLGVNEDGQLGLRPHRSSDVVALDACWLSDARFAPAFATSWDGAEEVELRAIGDLEPFAVVTRETPRGTVIELTSMRGEPLEPSTHSRVKVGDHYFKVSPRAFWQSHRDAPELLVSHVLAFADVKPGDHVVDLFSGVGLFSVPLAQRVGYGGKVVAVESSPYAVRDARENADKLRQLKVREWNVTPRAINDAVAPGDIVVLDPPRSGLAKGVAEAIVRREPRRLVYVSCDPATLARDLKILVAGGYDIREIKVFDLFPMTEHVESIVLLDKAN